MVVTSRAPVAPKGWPIAIDPPATLVLWPLTLEVCRAIDALDFDSDPADEIIAATSVVERVPLVTRDRKIRRSKVVPLAR